ncbi:MAG: DNA-binding protein, partial [Rhizobiaceae bacterium]|nr:DNA-binding protein [Rhizobiaceae bacterium]
MTSVLVDSNIFFDVMFGGAALDWSTEKLAELGATRNLAVNPVIWAEVGASFVTQADLDRWLDGLMLEKLSIS